LAFVNQPTNTNADGTISPGVTVDIEDAFGNLVTTDDSTVTVALAGGGEMGGTKSVAAVNGVATFTNLSPITAGTQKLLATDGNDAAGTSASFIVIPGVAGKIGFNSEPTAAWVSDTLSLGITVGIEDLFGNVVTSAPTLITLSVDSGPAGGFLGGTLSATTVNGLATFGNLTFGKAGTYELAATSNSFGTAFSGGITVLAPPTRRYLLNGIPISPIQLAAQQKSNASQLPPAAVVVAEEAPPPISTPVTLDPSEVIAEQSIQAGSDDDLLSQTPFATITAPNADAGNDNDALRQLLN
jgi:hypothetical protein